MEPLQDTYDKYVKYCTSIGFENPPTYRQWLKLRVAGQDFNYLRIMANPEQNSNHTRIAPYKLLRGVSDAVMNAVWG